MDITRTHINLKLMRSLRPGRVERFTDTEITGFQVWVGRKGISYYLRKRKDGREFAIRLGGWPETVPETARGRAAEALGVIAAGGDVKAVCAKETPLFRDMLEQYANGLSNGNSRRLARCAARRLESLGDVRVSDLTREDFEKFVASMSDRKTLANMSIRLARAAINRFIRDSGSGIQNPASGIRQYERRPRERYMTEEESSRFFTALDEVSADGRHGMIADVIRMLLYTGARKTNVLEMRLEEISGKVWTIPAEKFKGRRKCDVYLGDTEISIVDKYRCGRTEWYVFPHRRSLSYATYRTLGIICEKAGMDDFHIHDIRRTIGTWMLTGGTPIAVVSRKLGHSSISITERVYAHVMPSASIDATNDAIERIRKSNP